MERKKALAAAGTATLILGSTLVAGASMTGASFLGFGGGTNGKAASAASGTPGTIVKTRNIYDQFVVDTGSGATDGQNSAGWSAGGTPVAGATPTSTGTTVPNSEPDPGHDSTTPTSKPKASTSKPATKPSTTNTTPTTDAGAALTPTTVAAPSPTTLPTTTTTWPRGVPKDWPKDKPIPPMPPNCQQPQLEDNGVWNCDH